MKKHPVSDIPPEVSAGILCDPKAKHSATFKRTMMRSRGSVLERTQTAPKNADVRVQARAQRCNAKQLTVGIKRCLRSLRTLASSLQVLERLFEKFPSLQGLPERLAMLRLASESNFIILNSLKAEYERRTTIKPK